LEIEVSNEEPVVELTEGAREAVELVLDQVRAELVRRSAAIATDPSQDRVEITSRDVRRAAEEILPPTRRKSRGRSLLERVLTIYALGGLAVVLAAGAALAIQTSQQRLDPFIAITAVATVLGALVAVVSLSLVYATRRSVDEIEQVRHLAAADTGEFLTRWALIEEQVRRLAAAKLGDAAQDAPFFALLPTLADSPGVSADDLTRLDNLRRIRNEVAHGRVARLSGSAVTMANDLLKKLSRAGEPAQ
jgi:CTP:molybdopterin cytidylyltransferase MocA